MQHCIDFFSPRGIVYCRKNSSGQLMENEKHPPGVCGLDNSGNSCYLNAVFQCLCSTVPLVEHLLNQDTRQELTWWDHRLCVALTCCTSVFFSEQSNLCLYRSNCQVAEAFVRLLEEMWLGKSSNYAPVEARTVLCSIFPQFNNQSQQDAQELLLCLLNALHDDLKKVKM